ncbi:MAG TPA: trypsin-like peptidase domain-containing protein [Thermoleophilaceae bacterium]|jgi:hypothetical protein
MSHITGTVQPVSPAIAIGPDSGAAPTSPNTWQHKFAHLEAPGGTKFLILHFQNVVLPASNRLEVDLGYGTDVFTSADGAAFWTRPINVYALAGGLVPIRYVTNGAANGGVQIDQYGRGESHAGETGHPSISNSDPFQKEAVYAEPTYDPFWYCANPPNWENVARVTDPSDVRARVARSVGMIVSVEAGYSGEIGISTCSVTLVDSDTVITAGHCHTPAEAINSSITFDYQTDANGHRPSGYNARFYKVKSVLAHHYGSGPYDYSLLRLAEAPAGIPAIQMRHDIPAPGEQIFGIHHPNGAVKKLSVPHPGFDTVSSSNASGITVPTNFHVSGGSSGSGLFDTAGRIVGILSNGDPCHGGALSYYPTASVLQDMAPGPAPAVTRDVMVVFDRSGSMSENDGTGRTKIAAARDAVSLFVQLVRSGVGNRVGLVSFSTGASSPVDHGIAAVDGPAKQALIGPAPYAGGKVGALNPGGNTSIGEGLDAARLQFPVAGANPRAVLLLTDGMQNTPRWVSDVTAGLAGIDVHAIGFGTAANLDGALLTTLTAAHGGIYSRAESGLALEKFFSHAFGNIFEAGILMDPEYELGRDQHSSKAQPFRVCGEDSVTVVVGWDDPDATLFPVVTTPGGATVAAGSAGVEQSTGNTWTFLRIPLPHGGERDGAWHVGVARPGGGGEFPPPAPALRYFVNVIPGGGARLVKQADPRRYYTGDTVNPLVYLRYEDGSWPKTATTEVTVSCPDRGAGEILMRGDLRGATTVGGDTIPVRQATLSALEQAAGAPLVNYSERTFELSGEAIDTGGAFEPAGIFGKPLADLLTVEGDYTFHFRATYGDECTATRELLWSLHVDVEVDPGCTQVTVTSTGTRPDGRPTGIVTIVPCDRFGHHVGPGRPNDLSVSGGPGTTVTGPVEDGGDGSYTVPVVWDPGDGPPSVVVGQPGRPAVVVQPADGHGGGRCWPWKLLCLLLAIVALILLLVLILS